MGSHDGAETCELFGEYILHQITEKYGNKFGLYTETMDSEFLKSRRVESKQLKRTSVPSLTDNTPQYVHNKSNHPPGILKNVPKAINKRLCEISSDKDSFSIAAPLYQKSIDKSGYDHVLKFKPPSTNEDKGYANNRARNVIWYNPPYNKAVSSNIGRDFLRLIDEEFPKDHTLSKIFNRNTIIGGNFHVNELHKPISLLVLTQDLIFRLRKLLSRVDLYYNGAGIATK